MLRPGMITSLSLEIQLTILKTAHFVETDRKQKNVKVLKMRLNL